MNILNQTMREIKMREDLKCKHENVKWSEYARDIFNKVIGTKGKCKNCGNRVITSKKMF